MLHAGNYSLLFLGGALWLVATAVLARMSQLPVALRLGGSLIAAAAIVAIWLLIRPTNNYTTSADVERTVGSGKPTLIYFYSEY